MRKTKTAVPCPQRPEHKSTEKRESFAVKVTDDVLYIVDADDRDQAIEKVIAGNGKVYEATRTVLVHSSRGYTSP